MSKNNNKNKFDSESSQSSSMAHQPLNIRRNVLKSQGMGLSDSNERSLEQEHARIRVKLKVQSSLSTSVTTISVSNTSLSSSISRFRSDFDDLKCKMRIFGESLDLCRCIAADFRNRLTHMEKRLECLEKRERIWRSESNYSAIIRKNKRLSNKTLQDAKKLQMCGTEEEMREVAARICRNYLHGAWKTVEPSQLDFRRISGGLSNFLYYVALPDDACKLRPFVRESSPEGMETDTIASKLMKKSLIRSNSLSIMEEPKQVLLRIYGQVHGERAMDAIVTESVIFTLLSERRLGPKLHGVFSGGRIEQYIPARPLLTRELAEPSLSMKIAEKMAAIHSMDVPLAKDPNFLWKTMGKWLKTVMEERLSGSTHGKNEEEERIIKRLKSIDLEKEVEWLKKFIATVDSPVVFCHNDMQEGNILLLEDVVQNTNEDDVISPIYVQTYTTDTDSPKSDKENNHTPKIRSNDNFETQKVRSNQNRSSQLEPLSRCDDSNSDNNIKGRSKNFENLSHYEDANTSDSILSHISDSGEPKLVLIDFEYCAYNYRGFDIANHFQEWGYDYTNPEHPFYFENQENCPTLEQKEIFIKEYLKHYHANTSDEKEPQPPSIDEVNHVLSEVDAFAVVSHFFWCLWSVVNASKSQIPFGYWEYALSRLETYLRLKQEVVKKEKFGFPQKRKICEVDI